MKKTFLSFLLVFTAVQTSFAQPVFPEPTGFVNDFAEVIPEATEQQIQTLVDQIKAETSAEVAVVTVESMQGYDENTFSVELGRAWGVGNEERDDGVVFLTAIEERVTYIATGYGVEGYITDAQAFWITDKVVVPYFREGDYGAGILAGVEQIKLALVDLEVLPENTSSSSSEGLIINLFFWFVFSFSFIFPWVAAVFGRSKRWWPGGVVGAIIGLGIVLLFSVTFLVVLPLAFFGFLFDYIASKNYKKGKSSWWTGGGGSGWGGGSGFGGGSSGGFGGFSGGSFGGGGGGSSW